MHPLFVTAAIVTVIVFLTELTSNTATAATLVPVVAASAHVLGITAEAISVVIALSASCAFMLPVATPPNAIVFSTGRITVRDMATASFSLNLIGIVLVTLVGAWLVPKVLA
jgi:sodium-dependent dicarboxylate transporter 2/3/5